MSKLWSSGGRRSAKVGIIAAGVVGVAVASTGMALAAESSAQIEACGNGRAGTVQLSGFNQEGQGSLSGKVRFPASGCQLVADFWWAFSQVNATVEFDDTPGLVSFVTCNVGGAANGSTVQCQMPGQSAPDPNVEPAHFAATVIPNKDNPGAGGNGVASTREEAMRFADEGIRSLCVENNFTGIESVAPNGESTNERGSIVINVFGTCLGFKG